MCRNMDDVTPTEARAPYAQSIAVHLRLQREPRQRAPVIFHLIARENALTRLTAARAKESIVEQERRNASLGEATSKEIDVHLLDCTNTVSHGNRRHRFIGPLSLRQKEPARAQVVGALECHVAFFNCHSSPTSKLPDRFNQSVVTPQSAAPCEYLKSVRTSRESIPSFFMRSRSVPRFTPNRDAAPLGPLTRPLVSLRMFTIFSCSSKLPTTSAASIAPFGLSGKETASVLPLVRITDRSIRFSNSRTFPGHDKRSNFCIVADGTALIRLPIRAAYFCVKCFTSNEMSSGRSRKGGIRIGNTFNR